MRKFLLMAMLISATSISHAGIINLEAVDAGWYNSSGHHDPINTNYIVGNIVDSKSNKYLFHNFMIFDTSSVVGDITSAVLELYVYDVIGALTYNLYDVTTPVDVLTAGGVGLVDIYNELGSGTLWGNLDLSINQQNQFIQIHLNEDALTKLNSTDDLFAIGGGYEVVNDNLTHYAFGISGHLHNVRLILNAEPLPVPQPGSLILFCLGSFCLFLTRKIQAKH